MTDIPDIPDWMWAKIDPDHVYRDAQTPGGLERYGELTQALMNAVWNTDNDAIDEIVEGLNRDELQILVVWLAFSSVEWVRQVGRVMSIDDARMLYDLVKGTGHGPAD